MLYMTETSEIDFETGTVDAYSDAGLPRRADRGSKVLVALLLEDEPLISMDIEMTLGNAGFEVFNVMSCVEALAWLDRSLPDVVIVDIELRDGPCHEVVERLVENNVPFVVHSGDHPSMHENTVFARGTWLGKPSDGNELVRVTRQLLAL